MIIKERSLTLGGRIKAARERCGLSREEAGNRAGFTRMQLWHWETDLHVPRLENLIRLAKAFAVSVHDFLP